MLDRRQLLATAAMTSVAAAATSSFAVEGETVDPTSAKRDKFQLGFAPHPGTFSASAGGDVLDQIRFAADAGFTAFEHNGLPGESTAMQTKIGETLQKFDMTMGVFVAYGNFDSPTFARPDAESTAEIQAKMRSAVEIAKRAGAKWMTVVPGSIDQNTPDNWNRYGGPRLAGGYQTANVIDQLRRCVDILDPHDLVMVLEPLNGRTNHGGTFLQRSDQAFAICRAVDSPACKILFDIYHQQITEGNLIPNIDRCWDEIAYFQAGDNPGRQEPGTGEINYGNVFSHIAAKGFRGVIGMEHGTSGDGVGGEKALIDAYRRVDAAVAAV